MIQKENYISNNMYQDCLIKTAVYRLIFFAFGLLFIYLCFSLYQRGVLWSCQVYLSNCAEIKGLMTTLCFIFSICSFSISYIIRGHNETAKRLTEKTQQELTMLYHKKKRGTSSTEKSILKIFYLHLWNEMEQLKKETAKTLTFIENRVQQPEVKAQKISEALEQMQAQLNQLLGSFS